MRWTKRMLTVSVALAAMTAMSVMVSAQPPGGGRGPGAGAGPGAGRGPGAQAGPGAGRGPGAQAGPGAGMMGGGPGGGMGMMMGGGPGGGMMNAVGAAGIGMMIQNPQFAETLGITEAQQARIRDAQAGIREQMMGLRDVPEADRAAKMQEIMGSVEKQVEAILTPEQLKRAQQIQVQVAGPAALALPRVAESLNLTDAQKQQLQAVRDEVEAKIRSTFEGLRDASPEERARLMADMRTQIEELRSAAETKVMGVLTDAQKKTFEDLKGEAIDLEAMRRPRGPQNAEQQERGAGRGERGQFRPAPGQGEGAAPRGPRAFPPQG